MYRRLLCIWNKVILLISKFKRIHKQTFEHICLHESKLINEHEIKHVTICYIYPIFYPQSSILTVAKSHEVRRNLFTIMSY